MLKKNWLQWLKATDADVICLQEIKATPEQFDATIFEAMGYYCYWNPAARKGYSGVAILTKAKPLQVTYGMGNEALDEEGRCIRADFEEFSVMSIYVPSGSSGLMRHLYKMNWLAHFSKHVRELQQQYALIICGDFNICHQPIDIHNPVANVHASGFLSEERQWLTALLQSGFVDAFRQFNAEPHHYTWWSYSGGARQKNLGWRIDYQLVTIALKHRMQRATILSKANHSDHCPILLELASRLSV